MKTKDYIKEFKLDLENYEFNREEFIRALGKEFLDRLELIHIARVNKGMDFPFKVFQELVKEMQTKFRSISNKKVGKPFTSELFSAFYASAVIPAREKYFPEEHAAIVAKREKYLENKVDENGLKEKMKRIGDNLDIKKKISHITQD